MTHKVVIAYGEFHLVEVSTVEELDAALDKADADARAASKPMAVSLYLDSEGPDGHAMTLGVGRDFSCLTYDASYVAGDLDNGQPTAWWFGPTWAYTDPGRGIPSEIAREAAREYVRTGRRPANVEWTDENAG